MRPCAVPQTALAPIVGRADDLARLTASAGRERLVTVSGAAGCGKTRLVTEAAGGWALHGVVELAGTRTDPAAAALVACGIREDPGRPAAEVLRERLGREPVTGGAGSAPHVLVLDNCEHLREPVAALVTDLLRHCAPLRVVATSRVALGVPGEVVLPLAGLEADGDGADLFLERARRVQPSLPDDSPTRATAVRICRMADGLPLAIELAAAHARSLPPAGIEDGMADRIRFLTTRGGTPEDARHASLLSSLDWSADLVGAPAQAALRALSLFDGRFELDAALAATDDRDSLETLVEHSLVRFDAADGRYLLLDTVRAYAEASADPVERKATLERLLAWAAAFAREVRDGLAHAAPDVLERVARADAAVGSVVDRALEDGHGVDVAAGVVEDMAFGWSLRGRCADGLSRTHRLVEALDPVPPGLRWAHGFLAFHAGDPETGMAAAQDAADSGDDRVRARGLILLGMARAFVEPAAAEPMLADAEHAAEVAGDDWGRVEAAQCRAYTHLYRGDPAEALRCADSVVPVLERLGHSRPAAWDAAIRADAADVRGVYPDALRAGRRGIELATAVGEPVGLSGAWMPLLRTLVALGHDDEAARVRDEGLRFLDTHPGLGTAEIALLGTAIVASTGPADEAAAAARAVLGSDGLVPAAGAEAGVLLAVARLRTGDTSGARAAATDAGDAAAALGHRGFAVAADLVVAAAVRAEGGAPLTRACDALGAAHERGLRPLVADGLDLVAALHRDSGRDPVAARLHAAATRLRAGTGGAVPGPLARMLAPPPSWLDDPILAGALAEGTRLGEAGAVGYAQRSRGRRGRPRAGWDSLTPTEREIVVQVATGRSNAEIAAMLLVSPGTVRTHLRSVFAKLGVTSRTELAARAAVVGP